MITKEQYEHWKPLIAEYEQAEYEDKQREAEHELDDDFGSPQDDDPFEECEDCGRNPCVCDQVNNCSCGAWQIGPNGAVHISDCICGAG